MASISTIQKSATGTAQRLAPRYRVLLHNDDHNTMEYVVEALVKTVPSLSMPQAVDIMMQAHNAGVALVIACAFEHAEFYCEGLCSLGLTSTIEPDE
jgi:ATP-dependent Clp protease adaptor protein ClpS